MQLYRQCCFESVVPGVSTRLALVPLSLPFCLHSILSSDMFNSVHYKLSSIMNEACEPVEVSNSLAVQNELRVAIRFNTVDVPVSPTDRAQRVVNDFAMFYLRRHFSWSSDFIHFSPEFDSNVPKPAWIMCDFNIGERYIQVEKVPTKCWQVHYGEEMMP